MPISNAFVRKQLGNSNLPGDINELQQAIEGLDGLPTGAEWSAAQAALARVDPGTDGTAGDAYRVSTTGPHFRDPDSACPLDHLAAGDGTTDDYAAIMAAYDRIDAGGTINLAGKTYRSSQTITFGKTVTLDGGGWREDNGTNRLHGGCITFDAGVSGITIAAAARKSRLQNVALTSATNDFGADPLTGSETDDGVRVAAIGVSLDNVGIRFFGRDGLSIDTTSSGNANIGYGAHLDLSYNGRYGAYLAGSNSNAWELDHPNVTGNGGHGIANLGAKNTFISPHAEANDGEDEFDFYDGGSASHWVNPYSEAGHKFWIDTSQGTCFGGIVDLGAISGEPTFWYGATPTAGLFGAMQALWTVRIGNATQNRFCVQDNEAGGHLFQFRTDYAGTDALTINDDTSSKVFLHLFGAAGNPRIMVMQRILMDEAVNISTGTTTGTQIGTGATEKLGFWGATPVVQPAANADTSGATLGELETEVNELKATLRALGLIAT